MGLSIQANKAYTSDRVVTGTGKTQFMNENSDVDTLT
jgi:hypothetical protein